eukprot:4704699-Pleurochrysis_carterae.AAC.1
MARPQTPTQNCTQPHTRRQAHRPNERCARLTRWRAVERRPERPSHLEPVPSKHVDTNEREEPVERRSSGLRADSLSRASGAFGECTTTKGTRSPKSGVSRTSHLCLRIATCAAGGADDSLAYVPRRTSLAMMKSCTDARPLCSLSHWRSTYALTADRSPVANSSRRHLSTILTTAGQPSRRTDSTPFTSSSPSA